MPLPEFCQGRAEIGAEGEDFVERAALLECPGTLEVVELEEDLLAGHLRKFIGVRSGREIDVTLNPLPGLLNSGYGYAHFASYTSRKNHQARGAGGLD